MFPTTRMRRLRTRPALRRMLEVSVPQPQKLIWPVFLRPGQKVKEAIPSLPNQYHLSVDNLVNEVERVVSLGVTSVLLFPDLPSETKTPDGRNILDEDGLLTQGIRELKARLPEVVVFADLDLSEYTSHGHSGIINSVGTVQNDATLEVVAKGAVVMAAAGADGIAPSGMQDGQVSAIRSSLDESHFENTLVLSYSTKFASSFYDCFRSAVHNAPLHGSRRDCQIPVGDRQQAIRESLLDVGEGADMLMVKPALSYLDIIRDVRSATQLPIVAYNVSGEYALLWHAEKIGVGNTKKMAFETLSSMFRAGADLVISYWANQIDQILKHHEI